MGEKHQPAVGQPAGGDSALRAALERLDQAIDRLEAAVEAREQQPSPDAEEIQHALDQALAREAQARDDGKEIAGKLDGLINRLETVLGT